MAESLLDKMNRVLEAVKKFDKDLFAQAEGLADEYEKVAEAMSASDQTLEEMIKKQEKLRSGNPEREEREKIYTRTIKQQIRIGERRLDQLAAENKLLSEEAIQLDGNLQLYKVILENLEERKKRIDEANESLEEGGNQLTKLITQNKKLNSIGKKGFFSTLLEMEKGSVFQNIKTSMKEIAKTAPKAFASGLDALLAKQVSSMLGMITSLDETSKQFSKTTGWSREYESAIADTFEATRAHGVAIDEAGKAWEGLAKNSATFRQANGATRQQMAQASAVLQEIGVSAENAAESFDMLTKGLGISQDQVPEYQDRLRRLGAAQGDVNKGFKDADTVISALGGTGPEAIETIEGISNAAASAGVSVESLVSAVEKMDTLQGAAESAANLNAILGGNLLNSLELLQASGEERIRMLVEAVNMGGRQWDQLDRLEQKAIAQRAGIDNMTEANKIFGQSLEEYDKYIEKQEESAAAQKEAEDQAKQLQTIQERWTTLFTQFMVGIEPVLVTIREFLTEIIEINEAMGGWLIPTVLGLGGALILLSKIAGGVGTAMSIVSAASGSLAATSGPAAAGTSTLGKAMSSLAKGGGKAALVLLAIGAAVVGIGAGIWLAAKGAAALASEIKGLTFAEAGSTLVFLLSMSAGIGALAAVGSFAAPLILFLSGALWVLEGRVEAISKAMVAMETPWNKTIDALMNPDFASNILQASYAILQLAGGFLSLAGSLAVIKTDDLRHVSNMLQAVAKMSENVTNLGGFGGELSSFIDHLDDVGSISSYVSAGFGALHLETQIAQLGTVASMMRTIGEATATFKLGIEPVSEMISNVSEISSDDADTYTRVAEATSTIATAAVMVKVMGAESALSQIHKIIADIRTNTTTTKEEKKTSTVFMPNKRVIGELVREVLDKEKHKALGSVRKA